MRELRLLLPPSLCTHMLCVCLYVCEGERSVVKSLVSTYGVNCRDSQGRTPVMYAVIGELCNMQVTTNALFVCGHVSVM